MPDVDSFLTEWFIRYIEHRGMVKKDLIKIEKVNVNSEFVAHYKADKIKHFLIRVSLEIDMLNKIDPNENFGLVTINNTANIKCLIHNWKKFADLKLLSIYFINPFSKSDRIWTIIPYVHDRICDKNSLELGLKSMSEMVEIIDGDILEKRIKSQTEEPDL